MSLPGSITSNTRYHVHTHFSVSPRIPGLANIENRLQRLNRVINAVGRSFAVITAGIGLRRLAGAFISIHTEIENAQTGLAGLLTTITGMPVPVALERAAVAVDNMRKAAAALPGDLPQYLSALNVVTAPIMRAGGSFEEAQHMARMSTLAGFMTGKRTGPRTLPLDVAQALTRGIGAQTTQDLNILLSRTKFGADIEKFNALPFAERLEIVTEALNNAEEAAKIMGMTFDAQRATLRDNLRDLGREASGGLFNELRTDLIAINKLFEDNSRATARWAAVIDNKLLVSYLKLKLVALDPDRRGAVMSGVGMAGGALAARQVGVAASMLQVARGIPGVGTFINVITAIGAGIGNALATFPDKAGELAASLVRLGTAVGDFFFQITKLLVDNPVMLMAFREVIDLLTDLTNTLAGLIEVVNKVLGAVNWAVDQIPEVPDFTISKWLPTFTDWLNDPQFTTKPFPVMGPNFPMVFPYFGPRQTDVGKPIDTDALIDSLVPPQSELTDQDLKGPGDTNLNGPITIVIRAERVDNPDLVARSFREVAERMVEYRRGGRARLTGKPT